MSVKSELRKIIKTVTGADAKTNSVEKLLAEFSENFAKVPPILPESEASDAGKVLTVGEDGKPEWAEIPAQTPAGET